ncbi:AtPH1 family protein [Toxoplasma gondii TgCatPRC2]|uniref:AtPH1 family protein n=15 Tax=Toxoplasma gondii TaxID=5811 RepID=B9PKP3_TOXGV|nr:AtPH1 family protein [Toxoplasma gondii ME49]EPR62799.1 AtPH1 family protein [Toxoplasma gondii GT1]ESS32051.1 AtPH1 family protein [Toxoplasma gondii VEG]KAF4641187.1 AtPH1 family protein [Toxoplasma gondii]KFG28754.1 AtPH1 family protein [Toxoplasma gondii GAB2-2007-GAL-DOM2]KFG39966.1 AtPH1 family protein [Toxoplasma gondii p89]KFG40379.1 AtPH1 family protein [Toxoplasma gondii FOU]KFG65309.1 AtPH1 family protein [Toxoplasma gondii RUB]KFH10730.1 AtPH1 family protein [Toxoplasma gondi|eukprot:XP_002365210.1 AtPH1 family protein [Toxoplasma gondii ME49]
MNAFQSPSLDITISRGDVVKEGWLCKQSKFLKDWRRRWFVLTPYCLCSFKTSDIYHSKPTEILFLRDCSTVKSADEDIQKENAFRVDTPNRVFFLIADNNQEKESWIGHIGRQMVRPSVMVNDSYGQDSD